MGRPTDRPETFYREVSARARAHHFEEEQDGLWMQDCRNANDGFVARWRVRCATHRVLPAPRERGEAAEAIVRDALDKLENE